MLRIDTPVEYYPNHDLWVKREDLSCDGPRFSKTRGVLAHVAARPERVIGVLDTSHSQGGWAVARACAELGKECHLWFPAFKGKPIYPLQPQQQAAADLGAILHPLQAGRSAVLYHQARKELAGLYSGESDFNYMMPNALKLPESVIETALEVERTSAAIEMSDIDNVLVSCSSGTIAAGVAQGLDRIGWKGNLILHMGYSRPAEAVFRYIEKMSGVRIADGPVHGVLVDEEYAYKDTAPKGIAAPFPCNSHYDLKAFAWWLKHGHDEYAGDTLFWNIG